MKSRGFTLIELLVAMVIIMILISLLIPCLRAIKEACRNIACRSNIQNISKAMIVYDTQNGSFPPGLRTALDEPIPPPDDYPGDAGYDWMGWWWFNYLDGIGKIGDGEGSILRCPSRNLVETGITENILCGNYGANQSIFKASRGDKTYGFVGKPLGSKHIPQPTRTLLITDSGYGLITWGAALNAEDCFFYNEHRFDTFYIPGMKTNKDRDIRQGHVQDAVMGRHSKKTVNVGYVDGSVDRIKADKLFIEKDGDIYRNRYPLWIPRKEDQN